MNVRNLVVLLSLFAGAGFIAKASYIHLKAGLAQYLIANAYSQYAQQQATNEAMLTPVKPWPWADSQVLARLSWADNTQYVLSDASMRSLAFGPAHMSQTADLGQKGNSVIVGHRDTHFKHLADIKIGQIISLDTPQSQHQYEVTEILIVDEQQVSILGDMDANALTLITCYPFGGVNPNPTKRFVIRALKTT